MKRLPLLLSALLFGAAAMAAEVPPPAEQAIRDAIGKLGVDTPISAIEPTPLENLYAVTLGAQVFYVSGDGRYLLEGELLDLQARRSLTEAKRSEARLAALEALGEENMIVYEPEGEARYQMTVFTDIDCPYCRQLHHNLQGYLERGIRVRYVFLPRAGLDSKSYDKAVWAWCAEDTKTAVTRAMQGRAIERADCDDPVKRHFQLAQAFGARATPTIITSSGAMVSGYRPPEAMAELLARVEGR